MLWNYKSLYPTAGYCITRENVISTNVGQLLERRGKEFLGPKYKDPISSFSDFQEFSVSNPEVVRMSHQRSLSLSLSLYIYIYIYMYMYILRSNLHIIKSAKRNPVHRKSCLSI
jgi:hypothetical protein